MTFFSDIRSAMEAHLLSMPGLPAQIAPENVRVSPTLSGPYLSFRLNRTRIRPVTLGPNPVERHEGLFLVDLSVAKGRGPREIEELAELVRKRFRPALILGENSARVKILYAQGGTLPEDHLSEWFRAAITVGWWCNEMQ